MPGRYDSSAIEVLTGLEPVRKRPGMYTQTERPNHLAHEVIDNSVDSGPETCDPTGAECSADRSAGESACLSQVRGILARILRDFTA